LGKQVSWYSLRKAADNMRSCVWGMLDVQLVGDCGLRLIREGEVVLATEVRGAYQGLGLECWGGAARACLGKQVSWDSLRKAADNMRSCVWGMLDVQLVGDCGLRLIREGEVVLAMEVSGRGPDSLAYVCGQAGGGIQAFRGL
jgi:hypothetical protein